MGDVLPIRGQLTRINVREVWSSEAADFTPWLAREENLRLLGETIGLELELEAQEKEVGPFRADILCKDIASENWVLIENQLEKTDHTHLGQLITYAAGLRAVTVIWIASPFTEEHRAALDWLNDITNSGVNFFGIEVELWQIGDSPIAPKFNIISKPNDWTRTVSKVTSRGELTESKQVQLRFWTAFREFVAQRDTSVHTTKPLPQHWMSMGIGRSGFHLSAIASFWNSDKESYESNEIRTELVITDKNSKEYFALLEAKREQIESDLGYSLVWHSPDDTQVCRIYLRKSIPDLKDESAWAEHHEWLLRRLENFRRVFGPRVKKLSLQDAEKTDLL